MQTMITWISTETDAEEQAAMMDTLRSATRNTRFDKWLSCVIPGHPGTPLEGVSRVPLGLPSAVHWREWGWSKAWK